LEAALVLFVDQMILATHFLVYLNLTKLTGVNFLEHHITANGVLLSFPA